MLFPAKAHSSKTSSSEHLVKLWAERYKVDVSSLSQNPKFYGELVRVALPEARALTTAKLLKNLLERTFNQANHQAKSVHEYIPQILDFHQAQQIAQFAYQVYQKLLDVYQQQSGLIVTPIVKPIAARGICEQSSLILSAIPDIEILAEELEHILLRYQEQHAIAKDRRVLGFLSSLFNFTNKLLISQLNAVEKILLCPYFKFVEEQISIPWQRVIAAATEHHLSSPALALVTHLLPLASDIGATVYCQLIELFPNHRSTKGSLSNPDVGHSCLRDLNMFQAYLWLCVLEGSLRPIERELVPLCVMVMPTVGVAWEMTERWKCLLVDEIVSRVQLEHKSILLPYTQGMEEAFFKARKELGYQAELIETTTEYDRDLALHLNFHS